MPKGFVGEIAFCPEEHTAHSRRFSVIVETASAHLSDVWDDHVTFHKKHHVSRYYGDRNPSLDTREKRMAALGRAGTPATLVDELRPISCVGLAMQALSAGFRAGKDAYLDSAFDKIVQYLKKNDQDGCALVDALQKLGWTIAYWNPSPSDNAQWDQEDGDRKSRGWHTYRYDTVMAKNAYYFNKVDDKTTLVGFGAKVPEAIRRAEFFVGIAHTGYHVFPGFRGEVIEAHSARELKSIDNLQKGPFNPLARGGAPRWTSTEKYRSGIMCLPPNWEPDRVG